MSADLTSLIAVHPVECTGPGEVTCRGCRKAGWMSWVAYYKHLAVVIESSDWAREVAAGAWEAGYCHGIADGQMPDGAVCAENPYRTGKTDE